VHVLVSPDQDQVVFLTRTPGMALTVGDHGKPQVEGFGDQLIHQGHDHGIHHPGQS